jgi:alpha-tubulin suppressor-like RCC1 family protein
MYRAVAAVLLAFVMVATAGVRSSVSLAGDDDRAPLRFVKQIATGGNHALALHFDGTVVAWGFNTHGQLGNGQISSIYQADPEFVKGLDGAGVLRNIIHIDAGENHSVAITRQGDVLAWGDNNSGQVGVAGGGDITSPTKVRGRAGAPSLKVFRVKTLSAGSNHNLALLKDGRVLAWGDNEAGQLGDGTRTDRDRPVFVRGRLSQRPLTGVKAVTAGDLHSVALLGPNQHRGVLAWGRNVSGELGRGNNTFFELTPGLVLAPGRRGFLQDVTVIDAGRNHTLALQKPDAGTGGAGARVVGWGSGLDGQLGNGQTESRNPVPVVTALGSRANSVIRLAAAGGHSVALHGTGRVLAWGENFSAELCDGTTEGRLRPIFVKGPGQRPALNRIVMIAAGGHYTVYISSADDDVFQCEGNGFGDKRPTRVTCPKENARPCTAR